MFLDHIHQMFFELGAPGWLSVFGRPVFPILLFLFADSFHYTHSRKKLIIRLLFMTWLMNIGNIIVGNLFENGQVVLSNKCISYIFGGSDIKIEKLLDKYFFIWYPRQGKTTVDSRCLWLKVMPTEEVTKYVDVFSLSVCMSESFLDLHLLLLRVLLKL